MSNLIESMLTEEDVPMPATFREWMQQQYDADELKDIAEHGAAGGWNGMIYYTETTALHDLYEDELWQMLYDSAEEFGEENILKFLASMNGTKDVGSMAQLKNLIVWFAAEEIARDLSDQEGNEEDESGDWTKEKE